MADPYFILGVPATADDETIRAAYLTAIRDCPPERDRQRFERIRAAYEAIATVQARLNRALFDTAIPTVEEVVDRLSTHFQPHRPSPQRFLRVLGAK